MGSQDGRVRAKNVQLAVATASNANGKGGGGANSLKALKGSGGESGSRTGFGALAATPTGQRMVGSIKSYNAQKGFGFITTADLHGDVFFMKSNLPEEAQGMALQNRDVEYELMRSQDGHLRAQNIAVPSV